MKLVYIKSKDLFIKTTFVLLIAITTVTFVSAQSKRVQLSSGKITFEKAFKEIEKQTGYIVAVDHEIIDVSRRANITNTSGTTMEIMTKLLDGSGVGFDFKGDFLILRKATPVANAEIKAVQSIFGYVQALDNGIGFENAKVTLHGLVEKQTYTDKYGRYAFEEVAVGNYAITASYDNYESQSTTQEVKHGESARVMFLLKPVYLEDHRTWSAKFAYPEYENTKLYADDFINHIAPYQEQTLPRFAIKTNLLYYGTLMTNLGVEFRLNKRFTIDLPVVYKPFEVNKKEFRLLNVQPEMRYWIIEPFNGHFLGLHLNYTQFKIGGHKLPWGIFPNIENSRYEGDQYGVGFSYGYQAMLGKRLGLEFTFGFGYGYTEYKRYSCEECSGYLDKGTNHYFGPTKLGITLIYVVK